MSRYKGQNRCENSFRFLFEDERNGRTLLITQDRRRRRNVTTGSSAFVGQRASAELAKAVGAVIIVRPKVRK